MQCAERIALRLTRRPVARWEGIPIGRTQQREERRACTNDGEQGTLVSKPRRAQGRAQCREEGRRIRQAPIPAQSPKGRQPGSTMVPPIKPGRARAKSAAARTKGSWQAGKALPQGAREWHSCRL